MASNLDDVMVGAWAVPDWRGTANVITGKINEMLSCGSIEADDSQMQGQEEEQEQEQRK